MSPPLTAERAPAKINLCLFLGPARPDGRHELVTVFDSLTLCDELAVFASPSGADAVVCEAVPGPNLVGDALAALRRAGWEAPPVEVRIEKRIPVAAGMGGGSADAAAMLRLAPRLAPVPVDLVGEIAVALGADVPAQLQPGPSLGTGAGEVVTPLSPIGSYGVLVVPQPFPLSTPDVYREADRLGLGRSTAELEALRGRLPGDLRDLVVNDLQPAAVSLAPALGPVVHAVRRTGADAAIVCGSGPTVVGIFWGADGAGRARAAAAALPGAQAAEPVVGGLRHNST